MDVPTASQPAPIKKEGIRIAMVNQKGMVTIPIAMRKKYQIKPNSLVVFDDRDGYLAIKSQLPAKEELAGYFKAPEPFDVKEDVQLVEDEIVQSYQNKF